MKKAIYAAQGFFVVYDLAPICLFDAALDACNESCLIVQHTTDGTLHQLLCIYAVARGKLPQASLNVGRKMHFHIA